MSYLVRRPDSAVQTRFHSMRRPDGPVLFAELALDHQTLLDVAGMPNTYAPGKRVDLRLGVDAAGEIYLFTKSDGWIRRLDSTH